MRRAGTPRKNLIVTLLVGVLLSLSVVTCAGAQALATDDEIAQMERDLRDAYELRRKDAQDAGDDEARQHWLIQRRAVELAISSRVAWDNRPVPAPPPIEPPPVIDPIPPPGDGFTALPLVDDGRVVYVSAEGDDGADGLTPATAVRTPERGYDLLRDGYPDQLRFRAGDVFTEGLGTWRKSGRSAEAPMVVGVYDLTDGDASGGRPRFDVGNRFIYTRRDTTVSHLVVQGLYIRRPEGDPHDDAFSEDSGTTYGVDWLAPGVNILFEDCRVEFFAFGFHFRLPQDAPLEGLTLHRNIVRFCWNSAFGNSCGVKIKYVRALVLTENLLDHNGWLVEGPGIPAIDYRDEQCHNVYITPRSHEPGGQDFPMVARGNVFARGASHGIKGHPGGVMEHNLFVGNAIGGFLQSSNSRISHNVVLYSDDLAPGQDRGWGLELEDMAEGTMEHNVVAHRRSEHPRASAYKLHAGTNNFNNNIAYNWSEDVSWERNLDLEGTLNQSDNYLGDPNTMPDYRDPDRHLPDDLLRRMGERGRGQWSDDLTADHWNDWIRGGFEVVAE